MITPKPVEVRLEPCPFCSEQVTTSSYVQDDEVGWCAICGACGARVDRGSEAEAIAAWSRRAAPLADDGLVKLIDRLRGGVPEIGLHEDNNTELFDIEDANEAMHEAATILSTRPEAQALAIVSEVDGLAGDLPCDRDTLGRFVREAWVRWAQTQPEPKPSWLVPYDALSEPDKEADRQIGEAVAKWTIIHLNAFRSTALRDQSSAVSEADGLADGAMEIAEGIIRSLTQCGKRMKVVEQQSLARLIATLRAQPSNDAEGWRDIASAPKDGSEILILAHGMAIQARYCPGQWSDETPDHPAEYDGAVWCAFDDAVQFEIEEGVGENGEDWNGAVTHWRPLPAAPAALNPEGSDHAN